MRIATLGISHETNTFSRVPATYEEFEKSRILRGQAMFDHYGESNYTVAGYMQGARELGFDLIPLVNARTGPIGTITKDAYDRLTEEMFGMLREQGPWDAVLIANHGAAVSEEFPDMDGEFTRAVREIVGPNVPVGIVLDMHANVSKAVVANTDVCVVWRTNPHLDTRVRGRKCADLIYRTVKGEIKPVQWIETPPLVVNIVKQFTGEEPMKSIVDAARKENERDGLLDTSAAEGYPYADVEQMGMSFIGIADGDMDKAKQAAINIAKVAWGLREALNEQQLSVEDALKVADVKYVGPKPAGVQNPVPADGSPLAEMPKDTDHAKLGPIVLMDVGDNIGGGSSADSTFILQAAQDMGIRGLLQSLYDPESVEACVKAGVGAEIHLDVGGKTDDMHGRPVAATGVVRAISDGKYESLGPSHGGGRYYDSGTTVRFDTTDGHTLLLTSRRSGNTVREQMYHIGIRPEEYRIVVAKGVVSPRPAYQPIAAEIILVNSPGVTSADLSTFDYKRRRKPLYPFEPDTAYEPGK